MKPKNLAIAIFLLTIVNLIASANEITFVFGKVEVLRHNSENWNFVKKGDKLTEKDLIRLPPRSLIRLRRDDGSMLPTLKGGREITAIELISEGIATQNAIKGKRIEQKIDGKPAIDVLPLGNQIVKTKITKHKIEPPKISEKELAIFRSQLDQLPKTIIPKLPKIGSLSNDRVYPNRNIEISRKIFNFCKSEEIETENRSLLFGQILRHLEIPVELALSKKGQLIVIFDSGFSSKNRSQLTANQKLFIEKIDLIWLPIQIDMRTNFTTAWYSADRLDQ